MVDVAVKQLEEALGGLKGKTVLVLGLSYREDVKELAFSVALRLVPALRQAGARVLGNDPLFEPSELDELGIELVEDLSMRSPWTASSSRPFIASTNSSIGLDSPGFAPSSTAAAECRRMP